MILMSIKSFVSYRSFDFLEEYGIRLSSLGEVIGKAKAGMAISSMKVVEVFFGLYSLKAINIPLFLTARRCSIMTTILVDYLYAGKKPTSVLLITMMFVVIGAIVAGSENIEANWYGFILVFGNNLASAMINVVASVYNEKKVVQAFDLNFYFALFNLHFLLLAQLTQF